MRFTLLCASTALAASLMLSACSSGGSSSAIQGGTQTTSVPMGHSHGGYHMVMFGKGIRHAQTCQSPYYICYLVAPGTTTQFGWCLSTSGNCTSGVYAGKVNWLTTDGCSGHAKTDGPSGCTGSLQEDHVTVKASVPYTNGQAGYNATWTALVKSGSIKGESFVEPTGIIVGPY